MKLKNLLLTGLALLGSLSMSATDLYVIGANVNGVSWTLGDPGGRMQENEDGTYSWQGDVLGTSFKINDGTWSNAQYNIGATGNNQIKLGERYSYALNGNDITFADGISKIQNPRLTLNLTEKYIIVEGETEENPVEENYYLVGDFNDWSFTDDYIMTKVNENEHSYTIDLNEGDMFKFTYGAGWGINFGAMDNNNTLIGINSFGENVEKGTYFIKNNGDNFVCGREGRYKISIFDSYIECEYIIAEQPPVDPIQKELYLIGANVNDKSWELAQSDALMNILDDGRYEWTGSVLGTGFKINDGTWDNPDYNFGAPKDGSTLTLGEPFRYEINGENISFSDNILKITDPRVILDTVNGTITVTGKADDDTKEDYYLVGTFSDWTFDDNFKMTQTGDDEYEYTIDLNAGDEFKITYGAGWGINYGAVYEDGGYLVGIENENGYFYGYDIVNDGYNFICNTTGKYLLKLSPITYKTLLSKFLPEQKPDDPITGPYPALPYSTNDALHNGNVNWVASIRMPNEELANLQNNNVPVVEIGPNDETNFLYVWNETWSVGAEVNNGEYPESNVLPIIVGDLGWSGGGFYMGKQYSELSNITDDTHFHISYCAYNNNAPESIALSLNNGTLDFALGNDFNDNGRIIPSVSGQATSEWNTLDITIGDMKRICGFYGGIAFDRFYDNNILYFLGGGVSGTGFVLGNIYFYNLGEDNPYPVNPGSYYVIGDNVNGKNWELAQPDCRFEEISAGIYKWEGSVIGNEFKINSGDWDHSEFNIGAPVGYQDVTLDEEFTYYANHDSQNLILPYDQLLNPTIILDTNNRTITVSGNDGLTCHVKITLQPGMTTRLVQRVGQELNVGFDLDQYWSLTELTVNGEDRFDDYNDGFISINLNASNVEVVAGAEFNGTLNVVDFSTGVVELGNNISINVADGKINLSGLTRGETVTLYTVSGIVMKQLTAESETMTIETETGMTLVVRVGDVAAKVIL